jgi:hypothetical protein
MDPGGYQQGYGGHQQQQQVGTNILLQHHRGRMQEVATVPGLCC